MTPAQEKWRECVRNAEREGVSNPALAFAVPQALKQDDHSAKMVQALVRAVSAAYPGVPRAFLEHAVVTGISAGIQIGIQIERKNATCLSR